MTPPFGLVGSTSNELQVEGPAKDSSVAWTGALLAALLCMVSVFVGWLISSPWGAIVVAIGMPGTTFLAYRTASSVASGDKRNALVDTTKLTVGSILIADVLGLTGALLLDQTWLLEPIFLVLLLLYSITMTILVLPGALTWAILVRQGWVV